MTKRCSVNMKGLRDLSKCARLLGELSNLCVDVAVQETHFISATDSRRGTLSFFSAYGSRCSAGVSSLIGRSLDANVNIVFAGEGDRLVVADVAVKSFEFRVVAVYVSSIAAEKCLFFRRLVCFLTTRRG